MNVSLSDVFNTLQIYLGAAYINDIHTCCGRTWQVYAQADARFRLRAGRHRPAEGPQPGRRHGAAGNDDHRQRSRRAGRLQSL